MKAIIGNETGVPLSIRGKHVVATRENGVWSLPKKHAITAKNQWQNLRDLRACVREYNATGTH